MKRIYPCFPLIIVLFAAILTYANHFHNSFHFDDSHTIENNLSIRRLQNIPSFFTDATTMSTLPSNQSYRPLLTTSTAIDFYLGGKPSPDPYMFHITNFILFSLIGILLYAFLIFFLNQAQQHALNKWVAVITTGWFLLHAANAETVNYIIARSDIMSTLFIIAAFICYVYSAICRKYYLYLVPVLLGLLSKEQAVMFIPLFLLYKLLFEQNLPVNSWWKGRKQVINVVFKNLVPVTVTVIVFLFVRHMTSSTWTPGGANKWQYILTQPFVIFHYCYNFLFPVNLVADTDWTVINSYSDDRVIAGTLFVLVLVMLIIKTSVKTTTRPIAFGIAWFLLALAPTSLLPFAEVLNDHRTFFPYIGLFLACAALAQQTLPALMQTQYPARKWVALAACMLALTLHAFATRERNKVWATEESLWKENTVKAPGNGRGWMNYGVALMSKGDFHTAEYCFIKTTQLWPYYSRAYTNLGIVKQYSNAPAEAEAYFKKAISLDNRVPSTYGLYARFLTMQGRFSDADVLISQGLALSPHDEVLLKTKEANTAALVQSTHTSANKAPAQPAHAKTPEDYINISLKAYNNGNYLQCIEAAQEALKLHPGYDIAYNNICAAYNRLKQYDKAIEAANQGLRFNNNNIYLKGNLAEAYKLKNQ
ncbi:Tetratricopeptide repeat-containing protein [Filimonas lacunae]|uniref:Tetratricopeptide repeat-containing protein n=1 Tax=Filimonas lacunae TaxID=477680 RepID=A0A173M9U4_9BACT|nr:hypothetical protein [Filimonas lacunae]BAV04313.1 TPR repeat containing protein [Filimonas lacunae]SIT30994.1 Tetratricopeptide repeat-containing protein [Filimonas lacunae]